MLSAAHESRRKHRRRAPFQEKAEFANRELTWVAYIGGKRESRRLLGRRRRPRRRRANRKRPGRESVNPSFVPVNFEPSTEQLVKEGVTVS